MATIREKIEAIVKVYKEDREVLENIYETLNSMTDYVKSVNQLEHTITILRFKLEPEDYRERVELLDKNRRIVHNSVIAGVKMLNRMCKSEGLELFFEGDITDRIAIGDFAGQVTKETFENRQR